MATHSSSTTPNNNKLPQINQFTTPESIVEALSQRDSAQLQSGLLQLEKRSNALIAKLAPRGEKDVVLDYLDKYPTVDGVFSAWDVANKTNNSQLSTSVLSVLSSLIRLLSTDPFQSSPPLILRLLSQYSSHLERALNPGRNDVTTAALKLMNVVVGFGSGRFGRKVFECVEWNTKITSRLYRTRLTHSTPSTTLTRPSIRTLLSLLIITFLSLPDHKLKVQVLDTKGLLSGLVRGLAEDDESVVRIVLVGLWATVSDRSLGVEKRREIFDEGSIVELVKLYSTPSSPHIHRFFHLLTLWLSPQISSSKYLYSSSSRPLLSLLKNLKPTSSTLERELTLFILHECPAVSVGFWEAFNDSLESRMSSRWVSSITLVISILSGPTLHHPSPSPLSLPPPLSLLLSTILPPSLSKSSLAKSLQNHSPLVSFLTSLLLLTSLQKAAKVLEGLAEVSRALEEGSEGRWRGRAREVREALKTMMPDPGVVVQVLMGGTGSKSSEKGKKVKVAESKDSEAYLRTNLALRLLYAYHRILPSTISSLSFDFSRLPSSLPHQSSISLSYFIRLASLHSEPVVWGRPGDYYKNTLKPVLGLWRGRCTGSNRALLRDVLGDALGVDLLAGEKEGGVWTDALPVPEMEEAAEDSIRFFEEAVQKTLMRGIKATMEEEDEFSPLLKTVLEMLENENEEKGSMKRFMTKFLVGYIGITRELDRVEKLVGVLGVGGKEGKRWLEVLRGGEGDMSEEDVMDKIGTESPFSILLQLRLSSLSNASLTTPLLAQIALTKSSTSATQILIHRFVSLRGIPSEIGGIVSFLGELARGKEGEKEGEKVKEIVCRGVIEGYTDGTVASVPELLKEVLEPSRESDRRLARPFVDVVVGELEKVKASKKGKKVKGLSDRLLRSGPLVSFFDDATSISYATANLTDISLSRILLITSSPTFQSFWTTNFLRLCRSADTSPVAAQVFEKSAEGLMPLQAASSPASGNEWKAFVEEWVAELLGGSSLGVQKARVVAALVYRSQVVRNAFVHWLDEGERDLRGTEPALCALLEVSAARNEVVELPEAFVKALADEVLRGEAGQDAPKVVGLACKSSIVLTKSILERFKDTIPKVEREDHRAEVVAALVELKEIHGEFVESLEEYVNGCLAGLTRRFVEDEEDSEKVEKMVKQLTATAGTHSLSYKSHLLEPLITAIATKRMDKELPVALAAALATGHPWKSNEVTRHLNNIFASSHFRPLRPPTSDTKRLLSSAVRFATGLARASISSASSARFAERLMPFYGGTLAADDVALLEVFKQIEIVGGISLSIASKSWNSSIEDAPLEETRIGSITTLDKAFVRRSWLRACASKRTPFPKEHADITYDPRFLVPYLSHLIAEDELKGQDWISILESDALGLGLAALASSGATLRAMARLMLAATLTKLESVQLREKDEIVLILNHAKNCIYSPDLEAIPSVIALFLANSLHFVGNPASPLYPAVSRFLQQRSLFDQRDVPMFYLLFYSTSDSPVDDHLWLLKFLTEGLVRSQDWRILRRRQTFELLASFFESNTNSPALRTLVLQFLHRASTVPQAARELIARNGIFNWIRAQRVLDSGERRLFVAILSNLIQFVPSDKPGNAIDALEALLVVGSAGELSPSDSSLVIQMVASHLSKLTIANIGSQATHSILMDRMAEVLHLVTLQPLIEPAAQLGFYSVAMALAFARFETGVKETARDRELFSSAVSAGLRAKAPGLWQETLRSLSV